MYQITIKLPKRKALKRIQRKARKQMRKAIDKAMREMAGDSCAVKCRV